MVNIRNKGANGEREIVKLFVDRMRAVEIAAGVSHTNSDNVKRCSSVQADGGGSDIVGIPGLSIEVKRGEKLIVDKWWMQCENQSGNGCMPILFYRQNRKTWRVRMYMLTPEPHLWRPAELSGRDFFAWFEQWYARYVRGMVR